MTRGRSSVYNEREGNHDSGEDLELEYNLLNSKINLWKADHLDSAFVINNFWCRENPH